MEDSCLLLRNGCAGGTIEDTASTSHEHECSLHNGDTTSSHYAQSLHTSQREQEGSSLHAMEDSCLFLHNGHAGCAVEDTASTLCNHECSLHNGDTTNSRNAQSLQTLGEPSEGGRSLHTTGLLRTCAGIGHKEISPSHLAVLVESQSPSHQAVQESQNLNVLDQYQSVQERGIHKDLDLLETCFTQDATTLNQHSNPNSSTDLITNILLNTNHVCSKAIIVKLVSHMDICMCIKEVLSTIQIQSQATYNMTPVNWEGSIPPYAVNVRAFMNHTWGRNKGLPHDPNPNVRTFGEQVATS